jgi:hypothetical protein
VRKLISATPLVFLLTILITACSPKFDWREVHGGDSPYTVMMPAKPSEMSREIQLGQQVVTMHMNAAQIDGVNFAVGAAKMSDATQAQLTLAIIKTALIQKMAGHITHEKSTVGNIGGKVVFNDEFGASNTVPNMAVSPTRMLGRLVARDEWVYQVLVVGPEKDINKEAVETFLASFKPD